MRSTFNKLGTKTTNISLGQTQGRTNQTPKKNRIGTSPGKSTTMNYNKNKNMKSANKSMNQSQQQQQDDDTQSQQSQSLVQTANISLANKKRTLSQDKKLLKGSKNSNLVKTGAISINPDDHQSQQNTLQSQQNMNTETESKHQQQSVTGGGPSLSQLASTFMKNNNNNQNNNDDNNNEESQNNSPTKPKMGGKFLNRLTQGISKQLDDIQQEKLRESNNEFFQVQGKSQNIRTFVRFRPINKIEKELNDQGVGKMIVQFLNDKTVKTMHDNNTYTFDKIYRADTPQNLIYKEVFQEILDDALQGYNGTLFAYGPTGSGKTWTMFGPDLEDDKNKGVIPRCAEQLFERIHQQGQNIDFTIKVSMLEIYRENCGDLINHDGENLKIKETSKKGVYVQGLSWHEANTAEELISMIQYGFSQKQTRGTALNDYSSRSHTVVQIDIAIKHLSGAEKGGRINMIDLAGSEKVGKSKAEGESLEEAKKINLSLSCLGNVINALTTKSQHIPYRDSKLTRILQESLGGNYKTSLIVACSQHSNMMEETSMALRFAVRAKTIKTQASVNVKQSQESLRIMIDQLRAQLKSTQKELKHYKKVLEETRAKLQADPISNKDAINVLDTCMFQIQRQIALKDQQEEKKEKQKESGEGGAANASDDEDDDEDEESAASFLMAKPQTGAVVNTKEIQKLQKEITELENTISKLKTQQHYDKNKIASLETEKSDSQQQLKGVRMDLQKEKSENSYQEFQIKIYEQQISALAAKALQFEKEIKNLVTENNRLKDQKIEDYVKRELKFKDFKLSDYFDNSINFNYDFQLKSVEEDQTNKSSNIFDTNANLMKTYADNLNDLKETFIAQQQIGGGGMDNFQKSFIGNLDFNKAVNNDERDYMKIVQFPQLVNQEQNKDLDIILLKQQLISAFVINQHLVRTINALEWKQIIEYGKYKMNSHFNAILHEHISVLEKLLQQSSDTQKKLRKRFDQIEYDHQQLKSQQLAAGHNKGQINTIMNSQRRRSIRPGMALQFSAKGRGGITQFLPNQSEGQNTNRDLSWVSDVKEAVEKMDKDIVFSLVYNQEAMKKVQDDIKLKNKLLKKCWEEGQIKTLAFRGDVPSAQNLSMQQHQQDTGAGVPESELQSENSRLQNRIISIEDESKSLKSAMKQYRLAFQQQLKVNQQTKQQIVLNEKLFNEKQQQENKDWQLQLYNFKKAYERDIREIFNRSFNNQKSFLQNINKAMVVVSKMLKNQKIDNNELRDIDSNLKKLNDKLISQQKSQYDQIENMKNNFVKQIESGQSRSGEKDRQYNERGTQGSSQSKHRSKY